MFDLFIYNILKYIHTGSTVLYMYYTRKHIKTVHVCIFFNLKLYIYIFDLPAGQSGVGDIPGIKMRHTGYRNTV